MVLTWQVTMAAPARVKRPSLSLMLGMVGEGKEREGRRDLK